MSENTSAHKLVHSYSSTGANYDNELDSLKARFILDDMLIQVYVREWVQFVLRNAIKQFLICR